MYRTHNCGELRLKHQGQKVTLSGWVQRKRDKGGMIWIDLRDRYGVTQLAFDESKTDKNILDTVEKCGREYVLKATGNVIERYSKNDNMPTGDIEIFPDALEILSASKTPPFTIENESDGSDELRMKYRYLDIRRNPVKNALVLRHNIARETRKYLDKNGFLEIETPNLIKSTPEGARDFVVPSRMHPGTFYALPQSPQTFKQLLMLGGIDKYFQLVKCYRDEDLRADRQPEFSQIDCEMSFVDKDDIMKQFEGLVQHLFKTVKNVDIELPFKRLTWHESMEKYGIDKPDLRFDMTISELTHLAQNKGFKVFDSVEYVGGICAEKCASYSRKQLDELTKFVQQPQVGAKGLVYVKYNEDGSFKSSVDKFFTPEDLKSWADAMHATPGDLLLILAGNKQETLDQLSVLRLEMGNRLNLRDPGKFEPLWVVDFPLLEWDDETNRYYAMHHPFTSAKAEDTKFMDIDPGKVRANAYDMVINGVELGGGSIRIHNTDEQQHMFKLLGFTEEEARAQFGFLLDAFQYGVPPHGGIAFGFDRICALFGGSDSIRDYIAFPKNNAGRDIMIDAPATISEKQLKELKLKLDVNR
ncbi:MAG: aspartate--tRNA ligase [Candidatus Delongbacteria bacterium]|jgi:aspartyl-tRNA synthetase|nr:aspartate--tRNA ligase [Candidatus Delongbacteria bacterium]